MENFEILQKFKKVYSYQIILSFFFGELTINLFLSCKKIGKNICDHSMSSFYCTFQYKKTIYKNRIRSVAYMHTIPSIKKTAKTFIFLH